MAGSSRQLPQPNNRGAQNQPLAISAPVSPETLQQFVQNQGKQLDIELREQEIRKQEVELGDSYARASLTAQVEDRNNARVHERELVQIRHRNWLIGGISGLVITAGTLLTCVAYNQAQLALELVKTVGPPLVTAVAGILGGYSAGIQKGRTKAKEEAEAAAQK